MGQNKGADGGARRAGRACACARSPRKCEVESESCQCVSYIVHLLERRMCVARREGPTCRSRAPCCRGAPRCPQLHVPKVHPHAHRDVTRAQDSTHMPLPSWNSTNKHPATPLVRRVPAQFLSTTNHRPQTAACTGLTPGSRLELTPFHIQGHHRPTAKWQVGLAPRATLRLESTSIESSVDLSSARPTWT